MQLKITTDYAIRAILYLAMHDEKIVPSSEVAEIMGIPRKYLIQIGTSLKKSGLIHTYTGIRGGYRLTRKPDHIRLFDIIDAMEDTNKINRCLEDDEYCSRFATKECPLRRCYCGMQELWDGFLKSFSIAELLDNTAEEKMRAWLDYTNRVLPLNLPKPD